MVASPPVLLSDPGGTLAAMTTTTNLPPVVQAALEHGWTLDRSYETHRHPDQDGPCAFGRAYCLVRQTIFRAQELTYEVGPDGVRYAHSTLLDSATTDDVCRLAMTDAEVLAFLPVMACVPPSVLSRRARGSLTLGRR